MEYSINNFFGSAKHEYDHDYDAWDRLMYWSNAYYYENKEQCDKGLEAVHKFYDGAQIEVREYPGSDLPYEILVVEWN